MLRISPSVLDSFKYHQRRVEDGIEEWGVFIEELRTPYRDSLAMRVGRDFHQLLAFYANVSDDEGMTTEWERLPDDMDIIQPDKWEIPYTKIIQTDTESVTLSGRLDGIADTTRGIEFKTTMKSIRLEKYLDSMQWRCYLVLVPLLESIRYEVVQVKQNKRTNVWGVVDHKSFECDRYPNVEARVRSEVGTFVSYLRHWED